MTLEKQFKQVLNFLSRFNNWEETDFLFDKVSNFFVQDLGTSPLVIFSIPKGETLGDKTPRVIWNRDGLNDEEKGVISKFIEENKMTKIIQETRFLLPKSDSKLDNEYLFYVGDDETQSYLALLRFRDDGINLDVLDSFIAFLKNTYSQVQRWKGLTKQSSLVHIDDVTGLYNQRKLYKDLTELIRRYERSGENFALLFIDIDHFKSVNDNYGHVVGTHLLADLGKVLRRVLRDTDLLYRYGGDEFVAIVPDASTNDARKIGDRVLTSVRDELFRVEDNDEIFRISISVGIASFPRDASNGKEVLELADRMMYRAKNRGRGCVCLAGDFYKK